MALHMPHAHPKGDRGSKKREKNPRPVATLNMTEHEFCFFRDEWEDYKNSTGIHGSQLINELWLMMPLNLKKLAFNRSGKNSMIPSPWSLVTEDQMMAKIKSLAVSVLHPATHTVCLHEAKRFPKECTKAFAGRIKKMAKNCNL